MNRDMYADKKLHIDQTDKLEFVVVDNLLRHSPQIQQDCAEYLSGDNISHLVQPAGVNEEDDKS